MNLLVRFYMKLNSSMFSGYCWTYFDFKTLNETSNEGNLNLLWTVDKHNNNTSVFEVINKTFAIFHRFTVKSPVLEAC